jgi:hypothetical protein
MGKTYQITATKAQLEVISLACELLARVQLGQWKYIFDHLPVKEENYENYNLVEDRIKSMMPLILKDNMDGVSSSYGISNSSLPESNSIAFDIRDVIRNKLSWEDAVKKEVIDSIESPRKWPSMLGVNYDSPHHWGSEPLIEIK